MELLFGVLAWLASVALFAGIIVGVVMLIKWVWRR